LILTSSLYGLTLLAIFLALFIGTATHVTIMAFLSYRNSSEGIYLLDFHNGLAINVVRDSIFSVNPAMYEDRWLAYETGILGFYDITVIDLDMGTRLVVDTGGNDTAPVWSSQGLLAFTMADDRQTEVYVFDLKTHALTNISDNFTTDDSPVWSSDGRLAFVTGRAGSPEIYIVTCAIGRLST
jgi:Tol biopolymer transport system component